jgi:biotin carboxylase
MGLKVVVIDRNRDAEGRRYASIFEPVDFSDIKASLEIAKRYRIDGVIPLNDYGVPTAAIICRELRLTGLPVEVARCATDKALMKEIWKRTGVPTAAFCITRTLSEAERAVDNLGLPAILKPADSHGGATRGVIEVKAKIELPEALAYAQSFYADKRVIVEEVLEGSEHTVELIRYQGGSHILAISDREKAPPYFRVDAAQIFPADMAPDKIERIGKVASMAVRAIGIDNSPVHVEVCYTAKGPTLIELGARCGGGGIPEPAVSYATGVEMFKESVRIALGIPPVNLIPRKPLRGSIVKYIILRPGRLKRVYGLENVKRMNSLLDLVFTKKPGDEINVVRYGHDRCGHIVAGGGTRKEAIAVASQAIHALTFEYEKDPV